MGDGSGVARLAQPVCEHTYTTHRIKEHVHDTRIIEEQVHAHLNDTHDQRARSKGGSRARTRCNKYRTRRWQP